MTGLRRELAPITDAAWTVIEDQARRSLTNSLSLRVVSDVSGPHGREFGAATRGRVTLPEAQPDSKAQVGVHRVQPLIEVRVPFQLDIWELDNAERGAQDIDLSALESACWDLVRFEEETVFRGFPPADLPSLVNQATQPPIDLEGDMSRFLDAVARAATEMHRETVEGPYALMVPEDVWVHLSSLVDGRPLRRHVEYLIDGPVILSPFIPNSMLVSMRGGDLELVLGEDVSIGFDGADKHTVDLYLTESFTYLVHDPGVMVFIT
jgi:uncharacterized linocin/CFP29 family protein